MNKIECIHTESRCYKKGSSCRPVGIVVHSTGANNTSLSRYVQPSKSDPKYNTLINLIGKNRWGNHWNRNVQVSVHYMIGKLADGSIGTVHILPESICAWGVGSGKKGSYNYPPTAHLQFEVLEDNLKNKDYFDSVYKEAVKLCADICKRYNWLPSVIVSHSECYKRGYGSNHADIDHWLKRFGRTMDDFRNDVGRVLNRKKVKEPEYKVYTVQKGDSLWAISAKYLGSGLKYTQIKTLNGLKTNTITPGMKLKLPCK